MDSAKSRRNHRLHYRWAHLEVDRCGCGVNVGSPMLPLPNADRKLRLDPKCEYYRFPRAYSERWSEHEMFAKCSTCYETINYNTFAKNGCLKLTEVEMYFLSSKMTRASSSEWAVVYLGVGLGDRFRYLRDTFFPDLSVIAFDPVDRNYKSCTEYTMQNAEIWNNDGTNFIFCVRCFDVDTDITWVRERLEGKRLLLISDIRGVNLLQDDISFDKASDQELQWQAIQRLCPESSLVKFAVPDTNRQFFRYAPGEILKQVFDNYGSCEVRLVIEGTPSHHIWYNGWELYEKMNLHHEYLRGLVYSTVGRPNCTSCLDSCFDCAVLWETVCLYADQNSMQPDEVLSNLVKSHIYDPSQENKWGKIYSNLPLTSLSSARRWWDVEWALRRGKLTEAICILEAEGDVDWKDTDWVDMSSGLANDQPDLAKHLQHALYRPASREDLIQFLGVLSKSFIIVRTELNGLLN